MQIQLNYSHVDASDALDQHVRGELDAQIGRFADRVTRVEVHLADENAGKAGLDDKRVRLEARPSGRDPILVEAHGGDFYDTISDVAGKLKRALTSRLDRD